MSFYESHRMRPIYYSGPPQDSRLFYKKPRDLLVEGGPPVHGRRLALGTTALKWPPTNVFLLTCRSLVAQCH